MSNRNINRVMYDYLPKYYEDIREARAIIDRGSSGLDALNGDINDTLSQFYVDTATWSLPMWERFCGLPVAIDYTVWDAFQRYNTSLVDLEGQSWDEIEKSFAPDMPERRSAIKSKLRGQGTITKAKIAEICASYTGGTVNVKEFASEFRVVIEFTDVAGVPANIDTLKAVLAEVMPAHLVVEYQYRYLRWNELDGFAWTWDGLDANGLTWNELEEAVEDGE